MRRCAMTVVLVLGVLVEFADFGGGGVRLNLFSYPLPAAVGISSECITCIGPSLNPSSYASMMI